MAAIILYQLHMDGMDGNKNKYTNQHPKVFFGYFYMFTRFSIAM